MYKSSIIKKLQLESLDPFEVIKVFICSRISRNLNSFLNPPYWISGSKFLISPLTIELRLHKKLKSNPGYGMKCHLIFVRHERSGGSSARRGGGGEALSEPRELAVHQPQLRAEPRGQLPLQRLHFHQLAPKLLVVRAHLCV